MKPQTHRSSRRQSAHLNLCKERQRGFPLILTLSLGEREQQCLSRDIFCAVRFADRLTTILPFLGQRAGVKARVSTMAIFP